MLYINISGTHILNNNFLSCAKTKYIELDSLHCGKQRKISMSCCGLDLGQGVPCVELEKITLV